MSQPITHSISDLENLAQQALRDSGMSLTTAELQAATIGIGVADMSRFELQDLVDLLGVDALSDGDSVGTFVGAALDMLHADDMSFRPLLPDDDEAMSVRLRALANWCQSFLTGLVAGLNRRGIEEFGSLPDQVQEIIHDFAAIAQLETDLTEDESEGDFVELEEYTKVGTLLIMSFLDDDADGDIGR